MCQLFRYPIKLIIFTENCDVQIILVILWHALLHMFVIHNLVSMYIFSQIESKQISNTSTLQNQKHPMMPQKKVTGNYLITHFFLEVRLELLFHWESTTIFLDVPQMMSHTLALDIQYYYICRRKLHFLEEEAKMNELQSGFFLVFSLHFLYELLWVRSFEIGQQI